MIEVVMTGEGSREVQKGGWNVDGRSRERYLSLCKARDSSQRRAGGTSVQRRTDRKEKEKRRECLSRLPVNLRD